MLRRRIAKRAYLDPGIQYTLGRLTQYLVITIGVLMALTVGVGVNLTSLAVIFTALREQLGLRLESARGPVRTIVIDSVEKPTED